MDAAPWPPRQLLVAQQDFDPAVYFADKPEAGRTYIRFRATSEANYFADEPEKARTYLAHFRDTADASRSRVQGTCR